MSQSKAQWAGEFMGKAAGTVFRGFLLGGGFLLAIWVFGVPK